jgi:hypothetical protein
MLKPTFQQCPLLFLHPCNHAPWYQWAEPVIGWVWRGAKVLLMLGALWRPALQERVSWKTLTLGTHTTMLGPSIRWTHLGPTALVFLYLAFLLSPRLAVFLSQNSVLKPECSGYGCLIEMCRRPQTSLSPLWCSLSISPDILSGTSGSCFSWGRKAFGLFCF